MDIKRIAFVLKDKKESELGVLTQNIVADETYCIGRICTQQTSIRFETENGIRAFLFAFFFVPEMTMRSRSTSAVLQAVFSFNAEHVAAMACCPTHDLVSLTSLTISATQTQTYQRITEFMSHKCQKVGARAIEGITFLKRSAIRHQHSFQRRVERVDEVIEIIVEVCEDTQVCHGRDRVPAMP